MERRTIRVDPAICIGSGICVDLAPDTFELVDDTSQAPEHPVDLTPDVESAVDSCPVAAITAHVPADE